MTNDSTTESIDYEAIFEDIMTGIIEHGKDNPEKALRILIRYGGIDGAHHKMWAIDQAVRALAGEFYDELIAAANGGEYGPETYEWDVGIPP